MCHQQSQIRIINLQTINKNCPWSNCSIYVDVDGWKAVGLWSIHWPASLLSTLGDDRQCSLSSPLLICPTGLHFVTIDRTNLICSCYQDFLLSTNSPEWGQSLLQVKCENCFNLDKRDLTWINILNDFLYNNMAPPKTEFTRWWNNLW